MDNEAVEIPPEHLVDLRRGLLRLSRADRDLLWKAYVEGLKSTEIATFMGVEPSTARQRLARAAKRLRVAMGPGYGRDGQEPR